MTTATENGIRVSRVRPEVPGGAWQRLAGAMSQSLLAHSPEWATVIRQGYGHDPLYLTAEDDAGGLGLLPAFIVRRPLVGTIVTSMPFLDGGGPCACSATLATGLVRHLLDEARREGAGVVELRCAQRLDIAWEPIEHKVNMVLPLPADAATLWGQLDRSVRNQVRKAERAGLSVEFGGIEMLDEFYSLFVARMRDLGSPVHARAFFRATLDAFGTRARVALVRKGQTPIGGLIVLAFKGLLAVPWASCAKEYFALCPNMLLYWETIRAGCRDGFERFDFGRSTRGSGTYRFKRQWGALESPLFWYTIPIGRRDSLQTINGGRTASHLVGLWRHMPLSFTRRLGPHVRKYLVQ
jgi:FemAB-related protein (PEP-CTERM system-associated)